MRFSTLVAVVLCLVMGSATADFTHAGLRVDFGKGSDNTCTEKQADRIQEWIRESLFLFERGGKVLAEIRTDSMQNGHVPSPYQELLDNLFGPGLTEAGMKGFSDKMLHIAGNARKADILIRCKQNVKTKMFLVTGHSKPVAKYYDMVSIKRIVPRISSTLRNLMKDRNWAQYYTKSADGDDLLIVHRPADHSRQGPTAMAETMSGEIFYDWQKEFLEPQGSTVPTSKLWSDILLLPKFWEQEKKVPHMWFSNEKVVAAEKWYPHFSKKWTDLRTVPNMNRAPYYPTFSKTLMHELMHTHIGSILNHETLSGGYDANGMSSVLTIANTPGKNPSINPDSYVYGAICLSMPWIKWWDMNPGVTAQGTPAAPKLDGYPRWNYIAASYPDAQGQSRRVHIVPMPVAIRPQYDPKLGKWVDYDQIVQKKMPHELKLQMDTGPYAFA